LALYKFFTKEPFVDEPYRIFARKLAKTALSTQLFRRYPYHLLSAVLLTGLPLVCSSWVTYLVLTHAATIQAFDVGTWGVVTVLCVVACTLAVIPPTFLAIVLGYFLGWWALPLLLGINLSAIALVNRLVRYFDQNQLAEYLSQDPKVKRILDSLRQDELRLIFFTKLSPVLPFGLTNLVFAVSGASFRSILLGGFLGMIPRTALAVWTGMQAKEIRLLLQNPNEGLTQQLVVLALVVVSVVGLLRVVTRAVR
jgi:uncharacterized membrane protein YdjX (TVP38/TMEM64 family)